MMLEFVLEFVLFLDNLKMSYWCKFWTKLEMLISSMLSKKLLARSTCGHISFQRTSRNICTRLMAVTWNIFTQGDWLFGNRIQEEMFCISYLDGWFMRAHYVNMWSLRIVINFKFPNFAIKKVLCKCRGRVISIWKRKAYTEGEKRLRIGGHH
jgi:hypothetical protein